jgi:DNA repair protein RadC
MQGRDLGDLPARAIARFGSYACLLAAPERELRAVPGLGTHSIAAFHLLHNAALRLSRAGLRKRRVLDDPARLATYLQIVLARERIEQFRILFLDEAGGLIADEAQARGTVNHTPVYPREVVRRAIELDAVSLILVHNHPSGDPTPSADDLDMTSQVERAAATLGLTVRDHVIVGNGRVLSFREKGLLRA